MPFLDEDGVTRLTEDYLDIFAPKEELGEGDGTNAGPIFELSAKGHAEQFSTTGKNLLPNRVRELNPSLTLNGLTAVVKSDGSIVISGTASAATNFFIAKTLSLSGTYVMSGCPSGGSVSTYYMAAMVNNGWQINARDFGSGVVLNGSITEVAITINNGYTANNLTFYPQLEAGSEATEYEPYTGGAPSPSPDYPQEIQVVRGRNLIYKQVDGLAVSTAGNIATVSEAKSYIAKVKPNTEYTLSRKGGNRFVIASIATDSPTNGTACTIVCNVDVSKSTTTFTSGNDEYIIATLTNGGDTPQEVQLTLGSAPQPYVPYGHVGMEVQGKNLLPTLENKVSPFNTSTYSSYETTRIVSALVNVKPATQYTLSWTALKTVDGTSVVYYDANYVRVDGADIHQSYSNGYQFTTPSSAEFTQVYFQAPAGQTLSPSDVSAMLELGSEATEYEPYYHTTTPIPLPDRGWVGGLPDGTSDILTLDGAGKCEWELADGMETFDGSSDESWAMVGSTTIGNLVLSRPSKNRVGLCNRGIRDSGTTEVGQFNVSNNRIYYNAGYSNASELVTWLSTHPVTVLYPLATPIHESKGYIEDWPTDIPEGATITIPELDALNVRYFVANDSISQYAEQWYERTKVVDIEPVEDAIGDLTSITANLVTHDQFYFGYDEVNGKKMISIFKRGDI